MFFVVARDSEKDTFGVDGDTDYGGDDDLTLSTAFGLPRATRGTDNAKGRVNTSITTGENASDENNVGGQKAKATGAVRQKPQLRYALSSTRLRVGLEHCKRAEVSRDPGPFTHCSSFT